MKIRTFYPAHFIIAIKNEIPFLKKRFTLGDCEHFLLLNWLGFNVYKNSHNKLYDTRVFKSLIHYQQYADDTIRETQVSGRHEEDHYRRAKWAQHYKVTTARKNDVMNLHWANCPHRSDFTVHSRNSECHKIHCPSNFLQHTHKQTNNQKKLLEYIWRADSSKTECEGIIGD